MRSFLLSIAILVGSASMATAQSVNWSGIYLGGIGSYNWTTIEYPNAPAAPAGPPRPDLSGAMIGGVLGAQFQMQSLVLGVEGDFSVGNLSNTVRDGNYITQDSKIDAIGSVRGRVGLALGRVMPYITGGIAWDRVTKGQQCPDPAAVPFGHCNVANGFAPYNLSASNWNQGYVFGGGVEFAATQNWFIRAEVLRYEFGSTTYSLGQTPSGKTLGSFDIDHAMTTVRVGGGFKF